MNSKRTFSYLLSKKNGYISFFFLLWLSCFQLNAQRLKSSFVLDTTQVQTFPYDLDFSLKLVDSEKARIKYVYLIRIDNRGQVVHDRGTSFYRIGQEPNARDLILRQLSKQLSKAKEYLKNNDENSLISWKNDKKKKEVSLASEADIIKKKKIKNDINALRIKINKYKDYDSLVNNFKNDSKKYISDIKSKSQLFPLKVESRDKDTIIVEVKALKPNKDYLILAVNESRKTNKLKSLIQDYINFGYVDKKEVVVIPIQHLPEKTINHFVIDKKNKLDIKEIPRKPSKEIIFEISLDNFVREFEKAKNKNIESLLKSSSQKPKFKYLKKSVTFPGPFKYPITSGIKHFLNDSLVSNVPDVFSTDFRLINSVLVELNNYGDSIVTGKHKLEKDQNNTYKVNFSSKNDLNAQLNNIITHINLVSSAQQSLYSMAEAELSDFKLFDEYFNKVIEILSINRNLVSEKVQINSLVNKILSEMEIPYGLEAKSIKKSTFSYHFLTRNSGVIKQSFGFLYYFSGKSDFSGMVPFTGIDFQLRTTNENTKFWKIKDWKKFFSFQLGVPVFASEFNDGGHRKHLVGDAFSLYTGIGINLGHSVKIGYGTVLFRSIDSSMAESNSYKINNVHAISIGVNFKLIPLFRNIFGSKNAINLLE